MVIPDKDAPPERPATLQPATVSRARYRLLCSMLTTYAYGLMALAVAPTLLAVRQPPVWVTVGEIALAMVFLAMAFFIAPKGRGWCQSRRTECPLCAKNGH